MKTLKENEKNDKNVKNYFNSELCQFLSNDLCFDRDQQKEVLEEIKTDSIDFEVNDYRFIHQDNIDAIQVEELQYDEYILGCFLPYFLSGVLDIDSDVIKAMQEAEAYEAVGKLIKSLGKVEELQQEYSSLDGYGHYFSHYDGETLEVSINKDNMYYVFRLN